MSTRAIIERYAADTGWDIDSMFSLLCQYVDNQQDDDAVEDYFATAAEEELEEGDDSPSTPSNSPI